jgi:bifunctional UDP-N-acetylglucosamine pyrophosphorylase/glucosamine-1-phosphate N-acetyltransferase
VLILYGDVPLIRAETLLRLVDLHKSQKAAVSLISFQMSGPNSYGRVERDGRTGSVKEIVEFKDCSGAQKAISECNSGIYCVQADFLRSALSALKNDNAQGEYYLTDIVAEAVSRQLTVAALCLSKEEEVLGVNTYSDLALVNRVLIMRNVEKLIEGGVNVLDPASLFVDEGCEIEAGVSIGPNVQILGQTKIAAGVVIEGSALIKDSEIKTGALIKFNVRCEGAVVGEGAEVGPFAHLRPGAVLGTKVKVGNFVEVKMSTLEQGVKANHLSYLGNCSVGSGTNIGAGTITCNYDGFKKHQTNIGKNVFVGSDTTLVAPLRVGDGALIGAGSTIRGDVEEDALVLTRGERITRPQWAKNFREANKSNK